MKGSFLPDINLWDHLNVTLNISMTFGDVKYLQANNNIIGKALSYIVNILWYMGK
jgi:hypothetical protein